MATEAAENKNENTTKPNGPTKKARSPVAGNFSYTNSPKRFKEVLDGIIVAERPERFNRDFIEAVLNVKGGAVSGFPPILKRIQFLTSEGVPTELYDRFRSGSARGQAALEGLRNGFPELFKRNAYAHKLPEAKIKDLLVEITGRTRSDENVSAIFGTFDALRQFVTDEAETPAIEREASSHDQLQAPHVQQGTAPVEGMKWGLSYQINIVLPETSDITVFNAIFKSLRENLLRD